MVIIVLKYTNTKVRFLNFEICIFMSISLNKFRFLEFFELWKKKVSI